MYDDDQQRPPRPFRPRNNNYGDQSFNGNRDENFGNRPQPEGGFEDRPFRPRNNFGGDRQFNGNRSRQFNDRGDRGYNGGGQGRPFQPRRFQPQQDMGYRPDETKLHGLNTCLAAWQKRPDDVVKVYLVQERLKPLGEMLRWCAQNRKAYKIVTPDELERLTASVHHEGVCLITKEPPALTREKVLAKLEGVEGPLGLLYLDGVGNPHNIGNILRTTSHFGTPCLITSAPEGLGLPPSARRVSEGGSEYVDTLGWPDQEQALTELKNRGFQIVGTSSHAHTDVYQAELSPRCVFVLGSESHGISERAAKMLDLSVTIPGTGWVESLNVASAASILLAEHARRYPLPVQEELPETEATTDDAVSTPENTDGDFRSASGESA